MVTSSNIFLPSVTSPILRDNKSPGKVKCGKCGYSLTLVKANTKWHRYFVCSTALATKKANCTGTGGTIYADVLEELMTNAIREKLSEFRELTYKTEQKNNPKVKENKIRLSEIDKEIDDLLSMVAGANNILMEYINKRIEQLDTERKSLQDEILSLTHKQSIKDVDRVTNHIETWEAVSFEDKQAVVDALIKVIHIADGDIKITWNI